MDKTTVETRRGALVAQLQKLNDTIVNASVTARRIEGAIAICDEFLKEINASSVSSPDNEGAGRDVSADDGPGFVGNPT